MRYNITIVFTLLVSIAFSQEKAIYIKFNNEDLPTVIQKIEEQFDVIFSYNESIIADKRIQLNLSKRTLSELIDSLEDITELDYKILSKRYIIVSEKNKNTIVDVQELDNILIKGYLTRGIKKLNNGSYLLTPEALNILPGITNPDILESIQLLPGNFSPNETATSFFVRGGASDQNRLLWDGINIYHKGHLFGMISPLNSNIKSNIEFTNKGSHVRYGERLSSVIDVKSSSELAKEFNLQAGFDGLSADVIIETPLIKNKLGIQSSIRSSYTDIYKTITFNKTIDKVLNNSVINPVGANNNFNFLDFSTKLNYDLDANNHFYISILGIDNKLDSHQNTNVNNSVRRSIFVSNYGYGIGWNKTWKQNIKQVTKAYFSNYDLKFDRTIIKDDEAINRLSKRNVIFDSGVFSELSIVKSKAMQYTFGYQYSLKDVGFAFLNLDDLEFILDEDKSVVQSHSIYGNLDLKNEKGSLSFGVRSSYFKELNAFKFEPRLVLNRSLTSKLKLQFTTEIKNQILSEIDETILSDTSLENRVWRLVDGKEFPILNSTHISTGLLYKNRGLRLDTDVYFKKLKNISALSLGFFNPTNSGFKIGEQDVFGIDVFAKKRIGNINAWVSYTFNSSKNKFNGLNDNKEFRARTSITHILSTALIYNKNNFNVALGWKCNTGRPYTLATTNDEGDLEFNNGINTEELPVYHRLDVSSTYTFKMSKQTNAKVGFSIRNVYNKSNLISREYEGNNSFNDPIRSVDRYSIGITPNILFRLYW